MLTYEEELALSDMIVERRRILDELEGSGSQATSEQAKIIEQGNMAASNLVEAYIPAIRGFASAMISKSYSPQVTFEDLVNTGVVQALISTNRFNCRGNGSRPGKRFASYAGLAISKAMGRSMAKESTPLTVNVDVIITSYEWNKSKADLRDKLGYTPSNEQVEEHSGISYEYVAGAPTQSMFLNVDDSESAEVAGPEARIQQMPEHYARQEGVLRATFVELFGEDSDMTNELILMFGLDRMYVRDRDEMAERMGWGLGKATSRMNYLKSVMAHPTFRVKMAQVINQLDG